MAKVVNYDVQFLLSLGTLAAGDVAFTNFNIDASRGQGFQVSHSELTGVFAGKTSAQGPIAWGLAINMSAAEIEAALEADPQDKTDDDVRGESTWIKICGMLALTSTNGPLWGGGPGGANSTPDVMRRINVGWDVLEGQDYGMWARNQGSGSLTDGAEITTMNAHYGRWRRD